MPHGAFQRVEPTLDGLEDSDDASAMFKRWATYNEYLCAVSLENKIIHFCKTNFYRFCCAGHLQDQNVRPSLQCDGVYCGHRPTVPTVT
ncbi:Hypothetical protein CINCED_3A001256 [Cinara cedri]|uniref:Uncharacterized protein n=1 Tax=Cinara cedri TaxID=506608 RepID=A0A5E4NGL9_9HEMI|nr:Hypothetical protein CINCED_3A001256 [Cinara cedri]